MPELSVIIPARNEEWLGHTVRDILAHAKADTEIIVVLDGAWPKEPLEQHERVHVVYVPESIGQRAATNLGVRISTADYIMKLDAHCAVADGFDVELIRTAKELGPNVTQIPAQHNLHIFDRICNSCGKREYQGPTDVPCAACDKTDWGREVVWKPQRRRTEFWHFDCDLKFQYGAGEYQRSEAAKGEIADVMTSLGACMFISREFYWKLGGFDESIGSWGQFGQEWACKTWLSGGRHVVNKRTWFSHCFRTQGHNFGFPYPISGAQQEQARQRSRDLWLNDKWPGAVRPLSWLVDKFWPVPGWSEEQRNTLQGRACAAVSEHDTSAVHAIPGVVAHVGCGNTEARAKSTKVNNGGCAGVVYYSDSRIDPDIREAVTVSIEKSGLPIAAVTLAPMHWPAAIKAVMPLERGYLTMFRQILMGLEMLDTDYVFFAEHDVIYDESHWQFIPPRDDCYYYNLNWIKVDAASGRAVSYVAKQTSQLCASRQLLIEHYRKRIAIVERDGFSRKQGFEPGSHNRPERIDDVRSDVWRSSGPNYDVRHTHNLTPSRWSRDQFRSQRNCREWQESTVDIGVVLGVQQAVA